jgi:SAM-dependent methyltransferase
MALPSILDAAHRCAAEGLTRGDLAIDATVGNGHDTLFLLRQVGASGRVLGVDIQADALSATRKRVHEADAALLDHLRLVHDGHEALREHVDPADAGRVGAVMFNLGYLPGGDHRITTRPETTVPALRAAFDLLRPEGGVLTVVVYPGHEGGAEEAAAVAEWAVGLSQAHGRAFWYQFANASGAPPRLLAVEKRAP